MAGLQQPVCRADDMKRRKYPAHRNPVAAAILRAGIRRDVAELKTSAELHAWTGSDAARLVNSAGRMMWIVAGSAVACGEPDDSPDIRIIRGMGEALGDLNADGRLEFHRPTIQSGLMAIERPLPKCSDWALGTAALKLDELLKTGQGMGTADLRAMLDSSGVVNGA